MTVCTCGACELCLRRAALVLDDLRETAARLASHAGLPELAGRAFTADLETCAKIVSTAAATLACVIVGEVDAAAGAAVRCHQLVGRMGPDGARRVNAKMRELMQGEHVTAFGAKPEAS